ncbi:cytochrome c551 [Bacillus sp. TS-2]|nr:cytochrome c551 [Bacillus sp. TS-2]
MKGQPLIPFAIIAIVGLLLITILSFVGLSDREAREAEENGEGTEEEVVEIDDPITAGEELAQQSCISCHGGDLTGGMGPDISNLEGTYSVEEIQDIILNGYESMPAINVNEVEADAIAQYLLSDQ